MLYMQSEFSFCHTSQKKPEQSKSKIYKNSSNSYVKKINLDTPRIYLFQFICHKRCIYVCVTCGACESGSVDEDDEEDEDDKDDSAVSAGNVSIVFDTMASGGAVWVSFGGGKNTPVPTGAPFIIPPIIGLLIIPKLNGVDGSGKSGQDGIDGVDEKGDSAGCPPSGED